MPWLGFSLTFRYACTRVALVVAVIISALLAWRLVSVTFAHARQLALRRGRSNTRSLMLLGERVVKVLVVMIAVFGLLALAGIDPTTALAGVGIAGVASCPGSTEEYRESGRCHLPAYRQGPCRRRLLPGGGSRRVDRRHHAPFGPAPHAAADARIDPGRTSVAREHRKFHDARKNSPAEHSSASLWHDGGATPKRF